MTRRTPGSTPTSPQSALIGYVPASLSPPDATKTHRSRARSAQTDPNRTALLRLQLKKKIHPGDYDSHNVSADNYAPVERHKFRPSRSLLACHPSGIFRENNPGRLCPFDKPHHR